MAEFRMPSLGADMEAGTLVEWKVKPGDEVKRGDIVAVVETQKGAIEIEIFESGHIAQLNVQPGEKVPVGSVLATLDGVPPAATGAPAAAAAAETGLAIPPPPVTGALRARPEISARTATPGAPAIAERSPAPTAKVRASPGARAAAAKLGVALEQVTGTGPGGAITREDVERFAETGARPSGMRQAIAAAMARSKREIPHYYLSARIDLLRTMEWLRGRNQSLAPTDRLLPVVPLLKATALALRKVPELNGYFRDGAFHPSTAIHLGVAVSLREGGLIAPALHDCADKPLPQLMSELADLIQRTRTGQLRSSELSDATITVTSLGERGVEAVYGVIFPPQVALVGFGHVADQPWAIDGRCEARPTVIATLAADHRVSDGHRGGLFLAEVDRLLQHPEAL